MQTHDLIIIGAGPAGLTAALYAGRAGLKTVVLEKMTVGGRILMSEVIENFPGFPGGVSTHELISRMEEQVKALGIAIESEQALSIEPKTLSVNAGGRSYEAGAVIIAAGARPRKLNIPGEDKFTGRGVSYCAICDAPFFRDKNVAVVGGGNAVAEEALYLARFARQVFVIHRRQDLRASEILQQRLKANKKIIFILNSVVTEVSGSAKVESLNIKDVGTGAEKTIASDGVFIYIGYEPETAFLKGRLNLDESGFVITDENMAASGEGIFACGDCRKKGLYQVITACGEGAIAADSAYKYITGKGK